MTDDSQGGLRGDPAVPSEQSEGTRDHKRFVNAEYADQLEAEVAQLRQRVEVLAAAVRDSEGRREYAHGNYLAEVAARDHLRVRLLQLVEQWRREAIIKDQWHATMAVGWKSCAADLLAVLTEPQQHENETV